MIGPLSLNILLPPHNYEVGNILFQENGGRKYCLDFFKLFFRIETPSRANFLHETAQELIVFPFLSPSASF